MAGGWCEWSEWTPCSRTCGAESVSRYRSCSCPEPKAGGAACPGKQEVHSGLGVQIERQSCPVITFCPGETANFPFVLSQLLQYNHNICLWFLQSTVPGVLGQPGLIATCAPARPLALGNATAPPAGMEACLASERADRGGVAMTTPPSVLVSIIKFCLLVRLNIDLLLTSYIKGRMLCQLK